MAQSRSRSVFVGNIPYDVSEKQIIQICEMVGPVVSFRLVTDKETKKPKGYGFCEYMDEETALSACRNLQGYEIKGRKLRVDSAEKDNKNTDKNKGQNQVGPGIVDHPVTMLDDPLTCYLAKMSRSQLMEIMYELKEMATHNQEETRLLLFANPNLPKALFQAQIMLGMVPDQQPLLQNLEPHINYAPSLNQQLQPHDATSLGYYNDIERASKKVKLNNGQRVTPALKNMATPTLPTSKQLVTEVKMQFPDADVDPLLLQQVMSLTPDQLSSLPKEEQQQVIQLQQMLTTAA